MAEMNMIPQDYHQGIRLRRMLRNVMQACIFVLAGIAAAKLLLTYLISHEKMHVVRLEQRQQALVHGQALSDTLRQKTQVTQQQLAALDALRGHADVRRFLRTIDTAFTEGVWLDRVNFLRQGATGTLDNLPGAKNSGILVVPNGAVPASPAGINQGVEIVGHAMSHSLLADFMRKLGAQSGMEDLRLVATFTRNYTSVQVVDFTLTLQMKKKAPVQP